MKIGPSRKLIIPEWIKDEHSSRTSGSHCHDLYFRYPQTILEFINSKKSKRDDAINVRHVNVSYRWNELFSSSEGERSKRVSRMLRRVREDSTTLWDPALDYEHDLSETSIKSSTPGLIMQKSSATGDNLKRADSELRLYMRTRRDENFGKTKRTVLCQSNKIDSLKNSTITRREPACYELFCIHKIGLLIHRNQIPGDAERLAHRLSQLLTTNKT